MDTFLNGVHELRVKNLQVGSGARGQGLVVSRRSVQLVVAGPSDDWPSDGDEVAQWPVPASMAGYRLVGVHAQTNEQETAGDGTAATVQVKNGTTAMLTTSMSIDNGEHGSDTAATPAVIDQSENTLAAYDQVNLSTVQHGTTSAKGLIVTLELDLPAS